MLPTASSWSNGPEENKREWNNYIGLGLYIGLHCTFNCARTSCGGLLRPSPHRSSVTGEILWPAASLDQADHRSIPRHSKSQYGASGIAKTPVPATSPRVMGCVYLYTYIPMSRDGSADEQMRIWACVVTRASRISLRRAFASGDLLRDFRVPKIDSSIVIIFLSLNIFINFLFSYLLQIKNIWYYPRGKSRGNDSDNKSLSSKMDFCNSISMFNFYGSLRSWHIEERIQRR